MKQPVNLAGLYMAEEMGGTGKVQSLHEQRNCRRKQCTYGKWLAACQTAIHCDSDIVDNGKEVCTVDVSAMIIRSMIGTYGDEDDWPEYEPEPLPLELWITNLNEYEKYKKEGGYPPALTTEELHLIREFEKYRKKETQ